MVTQRIWLAIAASLLLLAGCERQQDAVPVAAPNGEGPGLAGPTVLSLGIGGPAGPSDVEQVRLADYSILFVGNSHTMMHDMPGLVGKMIQFRQPDKKVYSHYMGVGYLEDVARDRRGQEELTRPWKFVVLQAQKISVSGRINYSRTEGIDFAKLAKSKGASVLFFSEWGRKDVVGDGAVQLKIYQEMADVAAVGVAPISRAWDLALASRPEMQLHGADGNHQSEVGAFLTACVLFGKLTGESPASLAAFPYPGIDEKDRKFLADTAAQALAGKN